MRIEREWTCKRPFLIAGMIAFAASLAAVFLPVWVCVTVSCLLPLVFLLRACRSPAGLFGALCGVVFLLAGLCHRVYRVEPVERLAGQTDTLTGVVIACPHSGHFYTLRVTRAEKLPAGSRVLVYCSDTVAPRLYETLSGEVRLEKLYASQYTRRADGIFLLAYPTVYGEESLCVRPPTRLPWTFSFTQLRERMVRSIRAALPGEEGALLAGICLGEDRGLSAETDRQFRHSGLPHLLVVSGLHLTTVAVSLLGFFKLCRLNRRLSALLTMGILPLFMLLVGVSPSVVRAGVACLVMLAGRLFRRQAEGLNSMGLALVLLLAQDPYACVDIGLQLSFAAAAGVMTVTPRLYPSLTQRCPEGDSRLVRAGRFLWKTLAAGGAASCGATLFLTPLLSMYFGQVSLLSLPANLLAVMPAGWALILGWVAMLIPDFWVFAYLRHAVLYGAGLLCRWLQRVAGWFGGEEAVAHTGQLWQAVFITGACLLLILGWLRGTPSLRRRTVCFLAAVLVAASLTTRWLRRDTLILQLLPAGESAAILLERQGEYGLIVTDSEALWQAKRAVTDSPCEELQFILLAGMETPETATLKELLDTVPARHTLSLAQADWAVGFPYKVTAVPDGSCLTLWEGHTLTMMADGRWRLQAAGTTLVFCPAGGEDIPLSSPWTAADGVIFGGQPPAAAGEWRMSQGVLLCEAEELPQMLPALPTGYPVAALTEEACYLTTRGNGEWSIIRWQ